MHLLTVLLKAGAFYFWIPKFWPYVATFFGYPEKCENVEYKLLLMFVAFWKSSREVKKSSLLSIYSQYFVFYVPVDAVYEKDPSAASIIKLVKIKENPGDHLHDVI